MTLCSPIPRLFFYAWKGDVPFPKCTWFGCREYRAGLIFFTWAWWKPSSCCESIMSCPMYRSVKTKHDRPTARSGLVSGPDKKWNSFWWEQSWYYKLSKVHQVCLTILLECTFHVKLILFILEMYTLTLGHFSLIFLATPVMVPPVPAPRTTMSTLPKNKLWTNTF